MKPILCIDNINSQFSTTFSDTRLFYKNPEERNHVVKMLLRIVRLRSYLCNSLIK